MKDAEEAVSDRDVGSPIDRANPNDMKHAVAWDR